MTEQTTTSYFQMAPSWQWSTTEEVVDRATAEFQARGCAVEVAVIKVIETLLRDGATFGLPITADRQASATWRERCAQDLAWSLRQESGFDASLQPLVARLLCERAVDIETTEQRMHRPGPQLMQSLQGRVRTADDQYAGCLADATVSHDDLVRAQERFEVLTAMAIEFGCFTRAEVEAMRSRAHAFACTAQERDFAAWEARQPQRLRRLGRLRGLLKRCLEGLIQRLQRFRQPAPAAQLLFDSQASAASAGVSAPGRAYQTAHRSDGVSR